jgi:2-C-methyl-D-erythritol 4-phosphate cytidylyltransferase
MGGKKKPYLMLRGEPILAHALRPFLLRDDVVAVAVALAAEDAAAPPDWLLALDSGSHRLKVVPGGATRSDSVANALASLPDDLDVLIVHDAARPLTTPAIIDACVREAAEGKGAVAGYPAVDTLKQVDGAWRILSTPERARHWHAQTPQAFPAAVLREAYASPEARAKATDDASLVERMGVEIVMVEASPRNLKVTRPEDLALAEMYLIAAEREPRS